LTNIHLGSSTVCELANSNAFAGTQSTMHIYVPLSLVSAYMSATNWSYYSDRILDE